MHDSMLFHRVAGKVTTALHGRSPGNAVLITSARSGEGKTFVARALAATLKQQGIASVAVVDCTGTDRSPRGNGATSWSDLLSGNPSSLAELLHPTETDQPTYIPHGAGPAADLYRTEAVGHAIKRLSDRFSFVVLDGPVLADCGALGAHADGSVLVINAARTRREVVKGALLANPIDARKMLGAVLNRKPYYIPAWLYRRAL